MIDEEDDKFPDRLAKHLESMGAHPNEIDALAASRNCWAVQWGDHDEAKSWSTRDFDRAVPTKPGEGIPAAIAKAKNKRTGY